MKNLLKKNQLAILVIALMLVTAGYLNYTSNNTIPTNGNMIGNTEQFAAIGDATLVNSGELIEEKDKQSIFNTIQETQTNMQNENTVSSNTVSNNTVENTVEQTNASTTNEDDYFTSSKLERDKMYSQMIESYQKLLESSSISQEQKAISEQEITKINQTKNAIMIAENLISTKGFSNCVIFVNDQSVSVIIKAKELSQEEIAQIQNIIARELKVEIENIHISNK